MGLQPPNRGWLPRRPAAQTESAVPDRTRHVRDQTQGPLIASCSSALHLRRLPGMQNHRGDLPHASRTSRCKKPGLCKRSGESESPSDCQVTEIGFRYCRLMVQSVLHQSGKIKLPFLVVDIDHPRLVNNMALRRCGWASRSQTGPHRADFRDIPGVPTPSSGNGLVRRQMLTAPATDLIHHRFGFSYTQAPMALPAASFAAIYSQDSRRPGRIGAALR